MLALPPPLKKRGNKEEEQEQKQTGIILIRISFGVLKINRGGAQRTNPIRWTDRRWEVLIAHKSLYPIHFGCKQIRYGLIIIIRLLYWRGIKDDNNSCWKKDLLPRHFTGCFLSFRFTKCVGQQLYSFESTIVLNSLIYFVLKWYFQRNINRERKINIGVWSTTVELHCVARKPHAALCFTSCRKLGK